MIFGIWMFVWGWVACAPPAPDAMPAEGVGEVIAAPTATVASEMQATLPTVTPDPFESSASTDETTPSVPSPETAAPEAPPEAVVREHTVQPGETLLGLALAYDVPIAAIQLQNDLGEGTTVQAGWTLLIPPTVGWEGASPFWIVHEVGEGETLSEIAARYGVAVGALQGVNGLTDADFLAVGESLVLPLDAPKETVAAERAPTPTPLPPPTATPVPTLAPTLAPTVTTELPSAGEEEGASTPTPTAPAPAPTEAPVQPPPGDIAALAAETFRLINAERAAHGLAPLSYNATLARAAQLHAEDCYQRGWCGHTGSDGSTMKERIIRAGYDPARWSECWAWHRTPAKAVFAWMDEAPPNDPHRRTLLSTWLTEVGIGVMPGNGHGYYFIADFGKPK
ncbi:MAG: LysM peptidoglycan-binding domain-containing protein [Chloroflexi bacterium]|nr:LysM peptidoglycan-binding domain-containing protein [Chloroflexota bacterium]